MNQPHRIAPAPGKLAVLLPGMGAVATTMIAGVMLARRNRALPVGSVTQLGTLDLGDGSAARAVALRDVVPLAELDQLEFGGWDIFPDDARAAALHAGVLAEAQVGEVGEELASIRPMPGAFYPEFVRRLHGTHVKAAASKAAMVEALRDDVRRFLRERDCDRAVAVWCGSTEALCRPTHVHASVRAFEEGLRCSDPSISNSQLYAWALVSEGVPFANGSPNLAADFPAAIELARERGVPLAGKDFKTGQTLVKTMVAPGLKSRMLGLRGWYSTNILGNRDGEVLDEPDNFRAKEESKLGVLESILEPRTNEALYGQLVHKVRIDYYPPRGDDKEGWDNVDLFGWLGYPMQLKINFLCKDSILAAPIVLDLALLLDLAQRARLRGPQRWLGFYFKSPMTPRDGETEHDLFAQKRRFDATLKLLAGHEAAPELRREVYE